MIYQYIIDEAETPYFEGMVGLMIDHCGSRIIYLDANEEQLTVLLLKYRDVLKIHQTLEEVWDSWALGENNNPFRKSKSDLPAETVNSNPVPA